MTTNRTARLVVRALAAVGFILSLLYATAAPSDFTTGAPTKSAPIKP